ncbi:MAG: hypothetical protein IT300_14620 [Dehalococcoidia bacterium]|nr:hypothetical protein [Dehalococcoidia bacterium]
MRLGAASRTPDNVVEYGDGWMRIGRCPSVVLGRMLQELRSRCSAGWLRKRANANAAATGVELPIFGLGAKVLPA